MFLSHHKHFILPFAFVCLAFIVLTIRGTPCRNGQHCRDCDNDGDCSNQCDRGFVGTKCKSKCSSRCTHKSCELTDVGIEMCTEGCVPGFQGTTCNIPCGNPGTQCAVCDGGCDGGYCRLNSSCVSGCVDSYYGLECKSCSERCKSCNRSTGICDRCRDPYRGLNCEMSCENCAGFCESGCEGGCQPGFYGHWCDEMCSENCRSGPKRDSVSVLECDKNTPNNCIRECDNNTGDCIHGCNVGRYGTNCSSRCNSRCANMTCDEYGACVDGCAQGYAGTDCSCYENCIDHVCDDESGTCAKGCINGYYGAFCNQTCEICLDGICDRKFGTCIKGGNFTDSTCKSTCTHDCPLDVCLSGSSCEAGGQPKMDIKYTVTGLSALLVLTGILCAFCIRKCWSKRRQDEADNFIVEYQPGSNRYWEIRDADVNKESDSPQNSVLAEQLQEAHASETHDDLSSDDAPEDNPPYTHLVHDICIDDQRADIKYITPAEEKDVE